MNQNLRKNLSRFILLFSVGTIILFFQNCGGGFTAATQSSNAINTGQSTEADQNPIVPNPLPPNPTPMDPVSPNYGPYEPVKGFTKMTHLNGRICNLESNGDLRCIGCKEHWSENSNYPYCGYESSLTQIATPGPVQAYTEGCYLLTSGQVYCHRHNTSGQAGVDPLTTTYVKEPVLIDVGGTAIDIVQSNATTCALLSTGTVKCWGTLMHLPVGADGSVQKSITPSTVSLPMSVKKIMTAKSFTQQICVQLQDNSVYCWGYLGVIGQVTLKSPSRVLPAANYLDILPGITTRFCVLTEQKVVRCGVSESTTGEIVLQDVPGLPANIVNLYGAGDTRCAKAANGSVFCWGHNMFGRLGFLLKHFAEVTVPVFVPEWTNAVHISAGPYSTCATMPDTSLRCIGLWNYAFKDYLRLTTTGEQLGITEPIVQASNQEYSGVCFKYASGMTACYPQIQQAQDFTGVSNIFTKSGGEYISKPKWFSEPINFDNLYFSIYNNISVAASQGCYVTNTGKVKCWGSNSSGQLGNPAIVNPTETPVEIPNLSNIRKLIGYGGYAFCAIDTLNKVYCWGEKNFALYGSLVTPDTDGKVRTPIEMTHLGAVKDISMNYSYTIVHQENGVVKTYGEVNTGTFTFNFDLPFAKKYNFQNYCAVLNDDSVTCFNWSDKVEEAKYVPVANLTVNANQNITSTFANCTIDSAKNLWCWGDNNQGQLGQGNTQKYTGAVKNNLVSNVSAVLSIDGLACAYIDENLGAQSKIMCWGNNYNNENPTLQLLEKTQLRGYKPILNREGRANSFVNTQGQFLAFDPYRQTIGPFTVLKPK